MFTLTREVKMLLAIAVLLTLAIIGGQLVYTKKVASERIVNDARTRDALKQLWLKLDSISVDRQDEHKLILIKLDSLLHY